MREADDDEHFHGPWKGGSKAAGGRPMTKAEQAAVRDPKPHAARHGPRTGERGEAPVRERRQPGLRPVPGGHRGRRAAPLRLRGPRTGGRGARGRPERVHVVRTSSSPRAAHCPDRHLPRSGRKPVGSVFIARERGPRPDYPDKIEPRPDHAGHRGKGYGAAMYDLAPRQRGRRHVRHESASRSRHLRGQAVRGRVHGLTHRVKLEQSRERWSGVREAGDDHFYGAWKGGAAGSGGRPMTEARSRRRRSSGPRGAPRRTSRASSRCGTASGSPFRDRTFYHVKLSATFRASLTAGSTCRASGPGGATTSPVSTTTTRAKAEAWFSKRGEGMSDEYEGPRTKAKVRVATERGQPALGRFSRSARDYTDAVARAGFNVGDIGTMFIYNPRAITSIRRAPTKVSEADDDAHFHGAWKGGSKAVAEADDDGGADRGARPGRPREVGRGGEVGGASAGHRGGPGGRRRTTAMAATGRIQRAGVECDGRRWSTPILRSRRGLGPAARRHDPARPPAAHHRCARRGPVGASGRPRQRRLRLGGGHLPPGPRLRRPGHPRPVRPVHRGRPVPRRDGREGPPPVRLRGDQERPSAR